MLKCFVMTSKSYKLCVLASTKDIARTSFIHYVVITLGEDNTDLRSLQRRIKIEEYPFLDVMREYAPELAELDKLRMFLRNWYPEVIEEFKQVATNLYFPYTDTLHNWLEVHYPNIFKKYMSRDTDFPIGIRGEWL